MAEAKTLHDMFIDEIRDVYDAERQITKALPKMIKTATAPQLKEALDGHLKETRAQIDRLVQVFEELGETARGKRCDGIAGILEEGKSVMEEELDEATMDACLIAAGQRVEHYEIAAYGTLVAWARVLELDGVVDLLQATLDEETAADKKLSTIAEGGVNQEAAEAGDGDGRGRRERRKGHKRGEQLEGQRVEQGRAAGERTARTGRLQPKRPTECTETAGPTRPRQRPGPPCESAR